MTLLSFQLIIYYMYGIINEYAIYWYTYLILCLPSHMFNNLNVITLNRKDHKKEVIWINKVNLILKNKFTYEHERISGRQLMAIADESGNITFNILQKYYPNLDTLYVQYQNLDDDKYEIITKVIDIQKRMDIRSATKCRFGRIVI
jgi:hypothetical protein